MRHLLTKFVWEDCGQDLIEYSFLAVFLVLVILGGISMIGAALNIGRTFRDPKSGVRS